MYHKKIFVNFQVEGIHCYPDAKDIKGVEFLQHPHRHMFHFKVTVEVNHNERDIEFILFKRELEELYKDGLFNANSQSCETLATTLLEYVKKTYNNRDIKVECSEDGENGAIIEYRRARDYWNCEPTRLLEFRHGEDN